MHEINVGDRVKIFLGEKFGTHAGWCEGKVFNIQPYSEHRSFYWVELNAAAQTTLGMKQISVFNPRNIQKMEGE